MKIYYGDIDNYHIKVNYCPAYLMKMLANMTTKVGPPLGYSVDGKYYRAKNSFIRSSGAISFPPDPMFHRKIGIGGMTHPHLPITYYIITYNNFK